MNLSEREVEAALTVWGEWHRGGCRGDAVYSARAGAAGRWARRIDAVLPKLAGPLRVVLWQRYVEGLTLAQARQDARTAWPERRYRAEWRRAVELIGRMCV